MNSKLKNFLFLLFIFLFIIITAFAWLSASGYKFNLSWPIKLNRVLQKTGGLNLATTPRGAYIFLDDKQQKSSSFNFLNKDFLTTPIKLKDLLPGDYLLRFEKENYWPLEKRIRIESGQTTFTENINLFINDLPLLVASGTPGELIISPDNNYLFIQSSGQIINLENNEILGVKLEKNTTGTWMENNNSFFAMGKIVDAEKDNLLDLTITIGSGATNWHYNGFDNRLYFINQNEISRLDSNHKIISPVISGEKYLDYQPRENNIFVITENNKINLKNYSLSGPTLLQEIELPATGKYQFIFKNDKYLELYDSDNKTLYLINPSNLQDVSVIKNIIDWTWLSENKILFTNGWEISIFNLANSESDLITRVGESINRVLYHERANYFIFTTQNSLNVGDFRDGSFQSILTASEITYPVLDEKNDLLYFFAKINDESGIYKLLLQ